MPHGIGTYTFEIACGLLLIAMCVLAFLSHKRKKRAGVQYSYKVIDYVAAILILCFMALLILGAGR